VNVERRAWREHFVRTGEDRCEGRRLREPAVGDGVEVREVDHRPHPTGARGDGEDVLGGAELADASHDLDAERYGPVLLLQPLAQLAELLDDGIDRGLALATEQVTRMKDDDLGAGGLGDPRGMVEHPDRHVQLLATLRVAHEPGDRGMDREDDVRLPRELAEALRPRVGHPELALEVDLTGGEAALLEQLDGLLGALPRGHPRRAVVELGSHTATLADAVRPQSGPSAERTGGGVWGNREVSPAEVPRCRPTPFLPSFHVQ